MKYNVNFNQQALVALSKDLDGIDAIILDWALSFIASGKCTTVTIDDYEYFWLSYQKCIDDMPILRITHKDSLKRRFLKFAACDLLIPSPKNQELGRAYFRPGDNVEKIIFRTKKDEKNIWEKAPEPRDEKQTLGSMVPSTPVPKSTSPPYPNALAPRDQTPYDYSINDNTIKDNINTEAKFSETENQPLPYPSPSALGEAGQPTDRISKDLNL